MLGSFIRCQKDECDMTKIQNNAHLCGAPTHNKFLFKAPTVPSTHSSISAWKVNNGSTVGFMGFQRVSGLLKSGFS